MSTHRLRAWLTLGAVLVIVAVLGGLLVTAIVKVREVAELTQCTNNLKQLAIAVQSYHDQTQNQFLPPFVDIGVDAQTGRGRHSEFAILVPFLEATPYGYHLNRTEPNDSYNGHSTVQFQYERKGKRGHYWTEYGGLANRAFRCFTDPADATADKLIDVPMQLPDGSTGYYAAGSYAMNGSITRRKGNIFELFPKGAANTILVGERPKVCRPANGEPIYNLWGLGFYSPHMPSFATLTPNDPPNMLSTGQACAVEPLADAPLVKFGRVDAPSVPADFASPIQYVTRSSHCDPRILGTPHRVGMLAAMADGTVRTFALDTSPWILWNGIVQGSQPSND